MVKRIPKQNIVKGSKRVLPAGHPLLALYDPSEVIIQGEVSEYDSIGKSFPAGTNFLKSGSADVVIQKPESESKSDAEIAKEEPIDVPQLSDIESITPEEYKNDEGFTKIRLKIKIRNSSKNKTKVDAVDARISPLGV